MDYNDVLLFARVVEAGRFGAAADAIGIPKSSVSRRITRLESELKVRLLQRTTRHVTLTDAGKDFYDRVRGALAGLEDAVGVARERDGEPSGVVRLTAPPDAYAMGLPEAIAKFVKRHPGIHVELSLSSRIVDLVGEGFDLALRAGKLADSSLVARRVGSTDAALFAAPSYLKRRGRPRTVAELTEHECVLFRARGGRVTWHLQNERGEEQVEVRGPISVDDMSFVGHAIAAGGGIGLLPVPLAAELRHQGAIENVLTTYRSTGSALHIVLPSSSFVPLRVALLRDYLVEHLSNELARAERECARRKAG